MQTFKINLGFRSGELAKIETKRLVKQEKQLQKHKKITKSDRVKLGEKD